MKIKDVYYLPSGRVFLIETDDGFLLEATEMRDVSVGGKEHFEVRNSLDPHVIWRHLKPYEDKWLLTISTERGCPHKCSFCDVAKIGFKGNLSVSEMASQIRFLLTSTPYVTYSKKVKIGFARMGEPSHNLQNVLDVIKYLPHLSNEMGKDFTWLPCFNSILPNKTIEKLTAFNVIDKVLEVKEKDYNGFLHFQISCNSTDEQVRKRLFDGADVLPIEAIVKYINTKELTNRTVTLNFIVMKDMPVDVDVLMSYGLNPDRFTVKLIPLNKTINAQLNNLETYANYENYEDLVNLGDKFKSYGIPVVIDAIAKCEEAGLCCGQLAQLYAK